MYFKSNLLFLGVFALKLGSWQAPIWFLSNCGICATIFFSLLFLSTITRLLIVDLSSSSVSDRSDLDISESLESAEPVEGVLERSSEPPSGERSSGAISET